METKKIDGLEYDIFKVNKKLELRYYNDEIIELCDLNHTQTIFDTVYTKKDLINLRFAIDKILNFKNDVHLEDTHDAIKFYLNICNTTDITPIQTALALQEVNFVLLNLEKSIESLKKYEQEVQCYNCKRMTKVHQMFNNSQCKQCVVDDIDKEIRDQANKKKKLLAFLNDKFIENATFDYDELRYLVEVL